MQLSTVNDKQFLNIVVKMSYLNIQAHGVILCQ